MTHCNCIKSLCLDRLSKTLKPGSIPTIKSAEKIARRIEAFDIKAGNRKERVGAFESL